jgi:uncharacterized membrane protein
MWRNPKGEESHMAKPMFFYTGIYDNVADADADYEAIKSLHDGKAIGSYDSAVIVHTPDGDVKVTKTEKPTQKGAWIGLAAGAGAAVVFPFLLPAVSYAGRAGAGAGLGAWFGHLAHGTSRGDAKDIGAMLEPGQGRADRGRHRQGRRADRARPHTRGAAHPQARRRRLGRGRPGGLVGDRARGGRSRQLTGSAPGAAAIAAPEQPPRLREIPMKPFTIVTVSACLALALFGCGSSSDGESTPAQAPTEAPASATEAPASAPDQAATQVCAARADIQTQVHTLTTLSAGSATKADVTSALDAITTDLQKIKDAQADLTPERKQQVQNATTAFETQLKAVVRQAVAARSKADAKTQAENAAASLKSAVSESLQPIDC